MKEIARHIFDHALRESSIEQAFTRHVLCERGVLRICEDLYDLNSYDRVFVVAIGKAAHSMLTALHEQTGERFEGIVTRPPRAEPVGIRLKAGFPFRFQRQLGQRLGGTVVERRAAQRAWFGRAGFGNPHPADRPRPCGQSARRGQPEPMGWR